MEGESSGDREQFEEVSSEEFGALMMVMKSVKECTGHWVEILVLNYRFVPYRSAHARRYFWVNTR